MSEFTAEPRRKGIAQRAVLNNTALCRLLVGFAAVNVSEWSFVTALSIHAFREGGTLAVGLIGVRLLAGAVSCGVLSPLVDRRERALSLIALSRAAVLAGAGALVLGGAGLAVVIALVALDAVVAAPYRPAQSWLLPALARTPEELSGAAAGISIVKTLGQAAGALAGGLAVEFVSPGAAMCGSAAVMLIAPAATRSLTRPGQGAGARGWASIVIGVKAFPAVLGDGLALPLVLASVLRTLVRGLWMALLVVVALRLLRLGSSGVGLLQGAAGVGAAMAIPITASLIGHRHLAWPCVTAFVAAGVTVSGIGLTAESVAAVVLVVAWGVAMAVADATSLSLLHRLLDASSLSRTVSVMESLKLSAEGAGALLAPALVGVFGLRQALVVGGLLLPALMAITWPRLYRSDLRAAARGQLVTLLHRCSVFRGLSMAAIEDLASRAQPLQVNAGTPVFSQGDRGDHFYVVESGEAELLVDGWVIGHVAAGRGFGDRALLRDTEHAATVRATTPMQLYAIERSDFLSAATGTSHDEDRLSDPRRLEVGPVLELLRELPALIGLDDAGLERLERAGKHERWAADQAVVREGDPGDAVYLILAGRAHVIKAGQWVRDLFPGDSFGEVAVLNGTVRTATVTAAEELTTFAVPAAAVLGAAANGAAAGVACEGQQAGRPLRPQSVVAPPIRRLY